MDRRQVADFGSRDPARVFGAQAAGNAGGHGIVEVLADFGGDVFIGARLAKEGAQAARALPPH